MENLRNSLNKLPHIIQLTGDGTRIGTVPAPECVSINAKVFIPNSAVFISFQCLWIIIRMRIAMVIMAGIGGIRIMYFTHTSYPLAQSLQHSRESDAFIILNIQMRLQMRRLCELPKLTKLFTRRLELIPHLSDSKPILQYSLLSLWFCFFFFFSEVHVALLC